MARIVFVDVIDWDYHVETPYAQPLGGTQSSVCYLSAALAAAGHDVALVNRTTSPGTRRGVQTFHIESLGWSFFAQADLIIVVNMSSPWLYDNIRRGAGPRPRIVLWTQHAHDQPAIRDLGQADIRDRWDIIVLISNWQRDRYVQAFGVDPARTAVMRNAIGPAFEGLFGGDESVLAAKGLPPMLAYASTPYRGLDVLLDAFVDIQRTRPTLQLSVFSDMRLYQSPGKDERYRHLYERCRSSPGVTHRGSVRQPELAQELRRAALLAYPSTFAETSCIAVLEALAAGCVVVTSDLGALAETTMGMAWLVPHENDRGAFASAYRATLARAVDEWTSQPKALDEKLRTQVAAVVSGATWARRAHEWSTWFAKLP